MKKINTWQDVLDVIQSEGFRVADFARKTGIRAERIHNWKQEKGVPRFDDAVKLIRYFEDIPRQPTHVTDNDGLAGKYLALLETQITHLTRVNEVMATTINVSLSTVAAGIADISASLLAGTGQTTHSQEGPGTAADDRNIAAKADEIGEAQWQGRKVVPGKGTSGKGD